MNVVNYVEVGSLDEAFERLNADSKNKIIGGGAWLKVSTKDINELISLDRLNLNGIYTNDELVEIKAMTTLREVELSKAIVGLSSGILSQAISHIMGINIRNIATLGGSVMGRFSFSDIMPVLLVLNAKLAFHHFGEVAISDFLEDRKYMKDILKAIIIPKNNGVGYFKKASTTALDFAMVNLAIVKDDSFKIAVGSRPGMAVIAEKTCAYLNESKAITEAVIEKASEIALKELALSDNLRSSKSYREILVKTYIKRGLKQVIK